MNYYPYSNYYQQPLTNSQQYQPQTDDRQWVSNQQGAEVYPMQPNSFMRLWSSSEPIYYEKRTDATGRPLPLVAYRYEEVTQAVQTNEAEQSLREELKAIYGRLDALENKGKKKVKESENE